MIVKFYGNGLSVLVDGIVRWADGRFGRLADWQIGRMGKIEMSELGEFLTTPYLCTSPVR